VSALKELNIYRLQTPASHHAEPYALPIRNSIEMLASATIILP
jgi:hypothetical protein